MLFDRFRQPATFDWLSAMGGRPYKPRLSKSRRVAKYSWITTRFLVRRGVRHRHPLAPLYLTVVLLVAGVAGRMIPGAAVVDATTWALGAVLLLLWQRRRTRSGRPLPRWQVVHGLAQTAAAGGWLLVAILAGAVPAARVGIAVWGLAALIGWGLAHYRPKPLVEPVPETDDVDPRLRIWLDDVAAPGGLAPGTELTKLGPDVNGDWDAVWVDPRGKRTTHQLMGMQDNLGALFGAAVGGLVVEPAAGNLLREARIIVRSNNPVNMRVEMDDSWFALVDGCIALTVYADAARGWLRLYLPKSGTVAALWSGDSGSGKSVGMGTAVTLAAHTGLVIPFVGDPKKNSFPHWCGPQGRARWQATSLAEARRQARAMRRLVYSRQSRLSRYQWTNQWGDEQVGISFFDPAYTPWPIYEFTWDEAQIWLQDPEIVEILDEVGTLWRALGIRAQFGVPYPSADELGGSVKIRQVFNAGNTVAYRNNVKHSGGMILPNWMPNPADIPLQVNGDHTKGMCVLYSAALDSQRPAFSRGVFPERAGRWADRAAARIPDELDDDLEALGDTYATWRERRDRGEDAVEDVTPTVIDLGAAPVGGAAEPATPKYVGSVRDKVRQYLTGHGPATTGTIAAAIDHPNGVVSRECGRMREEHLLLGRPWGALRLPGTPDLDEIDEREPALV